jgi:hypothetical protein
MNEVHKRSAGQQFARRIGGIRKNDTAALDNASLSI